MTVVFTVDIAFQCKTLQWKKKENQLNSTQPQMSLHMIALFIFVLFYITICYVGVLGGNKSTTSLTSQRCESDTDSTQEDKKNRTTNRNYRMQSKSLLGI